MCHIQPQKFCFITIMNGLIVVKHNYCMYFILAKYFKAKSVILLKIIIRNCLEDDNNLDLII